MKNKKLTMQLKKLVMRVQNNPAKYISYFICIAALFTLVSCSATKYIPQGDALYTGAS